MTPEDEMPKISGFRRLPTGLGLIEHYRDMALHSPPVTGADRPAEVTAVPQSEPPSAEEKLQQFARQVAKDAQVAQLQGLPIKDIGRVQPYKHSSEGLLSWLAHRILPEHKALAFLRYNPPDQTPLGYYSAMVGSVNSPGKKTESEKRPKGDLTIGISVSGPLPDFFCPAGREPLPEQNASPKYPETPQTGFFPPASREVAARPPDMAGIALGHEATTAPIETPVAYLLPEEIRKSPLARALQVSSLTAPMPVSSATAEDHKKSPYTPAVSSAQEEAQERGGA